MLVDNNAEILIDIVSGNVICGVDDLNVRRYKNSDC